MSSGDLTFSSDGARVVIALALELYAECVTYAELLPSHVWEDAQRLGAAVAEHGEVEA